MSRPGTAAPPSEALSLERAARAAMARCDAAAAHRLIDELLNRFPGFAPGWATASALALELGLIGKALAQAEHGLSLSPQDPVLLVQRVRCLRACGRRSEALAASVPAETAVAPHPPLQHELANTLTLLGEHARALALMRQARVLRPSDPGLAYNLAAVLRFLGEFEEAEALLDEVIAARPDDWEAYGTRSQLRTQTADRNHLAELERKLDPPPSSWAGEVQLRYALAKELEDLGDYPASFRQLQAGASLRRRNLVYDVAEDVAMLGRIQEVLDAKWRASWPRGPESDAPIFVFGLPRSGTTLVERILGSHPEVQSLGELNDFPAVVAALGRRSRPAERPSKQELLELAAAAAPGELGEAYLARVSPLRDGSPRFIDKLPMNYLYAGLIAAALPRARLVHVERHPVASGYAMYKTLFHQGYPFSYDLEDLGRYIGAYLDLMAHWRKTLGERLVTIRYEDLVSDLEPQTRRLVGACGLSWNPACLAPHRNPAPSSTQSAVQVRRPVHTRSVDLWRNLERELAPLRRALDRAGADE